MIYRTDSAVGSGLLAVSELAISSGQGSGRSSTVQNTAREGDSPGSLGTTWKCLIKCFSLTWTFYANVS